MTPRNIHHDQDPANYPLEVEVLILPMLLCPGCTMELTYKMDVDRGELIVSPCACRAWPVIPFAALARRLSCRDPAKPPQVKKVDGDAETIG